MTQRVIREENEGAKLLARDLPYINAKTLARFRTVSLDVKDLQSFNIILIQNRDCLQHQNRFKALASSNEAPSDHWMIKSALKQTSSSDPTTLDKVNFH